MKKQVLVGIICTLLIAVWASAVTINVPAGGTATIQAALDIAARGDIVEVDDGVWTGVGNIDLVLRSQVTLRSTSGHAADCIIDCGNAGRAFRFYAGQDRSVPNAPADATQSFIVSGFTIRNGRSPISTNPADDPNITRSPGNGGGIIIDAGIPTIQDCIFVNCSSVNDGGGMYINGSGSSGTRVPRVVSCVFTSNIADNGGAIATNGPADIINCLMVGNSSMTNGSALNLTGSPACNIGMCTIADNFGSGSGITTNASQNFRNCIMWELVSGTVAATNCLLYDSTLRGTNCLYGYPLDFPDRDYIGFTLGPWSSVWGAYLGGYYLDPWLPSPAIDTGSLDIGQYGRYGVDSADAFTDPREETDFGSVDMGYHYPLYDGPITSATLTVIIDSNPSHGRVEVQGQTWGPSDDPCGVYTVDRPGVLRLTAIPDAGYRVRYWIGTYDDTVFDLDTLTRYVGIFSPTVTVHCSFEQELPVTLNYPGQYEDLNYAIKVARRGDTILVHPGLYRLPGYNAYIIAGAWYAMPCVEINSKEIIIRSVAPDDPCTVAATVFEGEGGYSTIFYLIGCTRNTVISGFTIRDARLSWAPARDGRITPEWHPWGYDGASTYGAGMQIVGSGTITNCVFQNCTVRSANGGNGIVVNNVGYDGGFAGWAGGGAVYVQGNPLFKNTSFVDCTATGGNGGSGGLGSARWGRAGSYRLWYNSGVAGRVDFASGTRIERQADGGAVFIRTGNTEFEGCTFDNCSSSSGISGTGSIPTVAKDMSTAGGAVYVGSDQDTGQALNAILGTASARFTDCTFTNNRTRVRTQASFENPYLGFGGAVAADKTASLIFVGCTFGPSNANPTVGNVANLGGAIYWNGKSDNTGSGGAMVINDSSFSLSAAFQGGAIYGQWGSLSMLNSRFDRNAASAAAVLGSGDPNVTILGVLGQGGGVYLGSVSSLVGDCIFSLNEASHSGGGLCVAGFNRVRMPIPRIHNNLFVGNSADRDGGGIVSTDGSEPNIGLNTIAYNRATGSGYATGSGGGMSVTAGSRAQVFDSVLWGNTAPVGPQLSLVDPNGLHSYQFSYATVRYSRLQGGQSNVATDAGSFLIYNNNLEGTSGRPFLYDYITDAAGFVSDYSLDPNSPCIDAGTNMDLDQSPPVAGVQPVLPLGRYAYTVRSSISPSDGARDTGFVDLGYHRRKAGTYPRGDIDYSGIVDALDLGAMSEYWLYTCAYPDWCEGADLNHTSIVEPNAPPYNTSMVNFNDEALLAQLYGSGDVTAPSPNPMRWLLSPAADSSTSIIMTAATAADNSGNPVEYLFECVSVGGNSSGWRSRLTDPNASTYRDVGLTLGNEYGYRVKARDNATPPNETDWSPTLYAFVGEDGRAPIPNPSQWLTPPYAVSSDMISMIAQTAIDASGVEYYFRCESGTLGYDSGWQASPSFDNRNLLPYTTYTYTVRTRDLSTAQNMGDSSVAMSATTLAQPDVEAPIPSTAQWYTKPYAVSETQVQMLAVTAYDPSGVEYFFECTLGGHSYDSGWQVSPGYFVPNLTPNTDYTFRILVRDRSINRNACTASMEATVTTVYAGGGPGTPPTPDPMQWGTLPAQIELTDGAYHTMQAVVAADIDGGIQYYFQCITAPSLTSGWINAPVYSVRVGDPCELKTYTWRVKARDIYHAETGWSASSTAGVSSPPTPNPMQWDPVGLPSQVVLADGVYHSMIATVATDPDGAVEYYFDCVTNATVSSVWQSSPEYSVKIGNLGDPNAYGWRVKARDIYGVETDWSPILVAGAATPPTPNPAQWDIVPTPQLKPDGVHHTMKAVIATDPDGGIEYYFQCMTAPSVSSGWRSSTSYDVKVCSTGETRTYTWRVKARDVLGNETGWSTAIVAGPVAPSPNPMQWDLQPVQELLVAGSYGPAGYYHTMDAVSATDADGGIQYYFDCITNPAASSGWQSSRFFKKQVGDTVSPQTYTWRVKARDLFGTETDWSPMATVVGAGVAPTPNPMQWLITPFQTAAADGMYHNMMAVTATSTNGAVEYYFDCITNPSSSSGWVVSTIYSVKVGEPGQPKAYAWRVKARDIYGSETAWSATAEVTAGLAPPTPNPMTWAATSAITVTGGQTLSNGTPTQVLATETATGIYGYWHCMTAAKAVDYTGSSFGVEYYFECMTYSPLSSGWIPGDPVSTTGPGYPVLVGMPGWPQRYLWRVKARDAWGVETGWSAPAVAGGVPF